MDLKQNKKPDYNEERDCFMAIKNNNLEKLSAFINNYGVDAPVDDGTCLHHAIFNNNLRLTKYLLDKSANPNALYENRITPLIASIDLNFWDIAKVLIENGADVNLKDEKNNTPLSKAIFHYEGNPDLIKLLLSMGADPYQNLAEGYTAVDLAKSMRLTDILDLINVKPK